MRATTRSTCPWGLSRQRSICTDYLEPPYRSPVELQPQLTDLSTILTSSLPVPQVPNCRMTASRQFQSPMAVNALIYRLFSTDIRTQDPALSD